jgi:hypothetical protein
MVIIGFSSNKQWFEESKFSEASPQDVIYIETEADFENFLLDGSNNNILSGAPDIQSITTGKKYILCNDIYLTRKSYDISKEKTWISGYFNGEFDGRGHSIIGFEIDDIRAWYTNGERIIAENNGFALFSVIGKEGRVKNLNIINAKVSFASAGAAILVGTNSGVVDNVKVQGAVNGNKWAGGICCINLGTIQNSLSMASVTVSNWNPNAPEVEGGIRVAGYITAMNSAGVYNTDPEDPNAFNLIGNIYHTYEDDALNTCQMGQDVDWNGFQYNQIKDAPKVVDSVPNAYLIEDTGNYLVKDYLGIVCYLEYIKAELALHKPIADIKNAIIQNDINLYNIAIDPDQFPFCSEVLSGVSDSEDPDLSNKLIRNGFNFYNREKAGLDFYGFKDCTYLTLPDPSLELEYMGSEETKGTKVNPYLIKSVSDLRFLSDKSTANMYYMLTNNIDMSPYMLAIEEPLISTFNGALDGNGFSITNIFGFALIGNISSSGTVKNIRLSGQVSGDYALLAQKNEGVIENVEIDVVITSENGVGMVYTNDSIITLSTLRTTGNIGVATIAKNCTENSSGTSSISHTRTTSLYSTDEGVHGVSFVGVSANPSSISIEFCTNVNDVWGIGTENLCKCSWLDATGAIKSTGDNVYSLTPVTDENKAFYTTSCTYPLGWIYPLKSNDRGKFAFKAGVVKDIPELVFPNDNKTYKEITFLRDVYSAPISKRYASNPISYNEITIDTMNMASGWDFSNEIYSGENFKIRYGEEESSYIIGLQEDNVIPQLAIEVLTKMGLSEDIKTAINNEAFIWAGVAGPNLVLRDEEYSFHMYSEYVDIIGTFLYNADAKILSFKRKDYTLYANSIFYDDIFPSLPADSVVENLVLKVAKETPDNYLTNSILSDTGDYIFSALIESTTQRTKFYREYNVRLEKGIFDMTEQELLSSINGLNSPVGAPVFTGNPENFVTSLNFDKVKPNLYEKELIITKLIRPDGSESTASKFILAGEYNCILKISGTKYEIKEFPISLFINPKTLVVSNSMPNNNIVYCDSIPGIVTSFEGDVPNYPIVVSFSSNYVAGMSGIGTYEVNLYVDTITDENRNYLNYYNCTSLVPDKLSFTVSPADLNLSNGPFVDKEVTFDGENQEFVVDVSKIIPANVNVSVEYIYGDVVPPFKNVGVYTVTARLDAGNNYNVAEVTASLTIKKLTVRLKAEDKVVFYGDNEPNWSFKAFKNETNEDVSNLIRSQLIEEGIDVEYSCDYVSSSVTGWPEKWDFGDNCYKLAIKIDNYSALTANDYTNMTIILNASSDDSNGLLSIKKIEYHPELSTNEIVYTGNTVQLNFIYNLEPSNRQWYSVSTQDSNMTLLNQAPINVSLYETGVRPAANKYMLKCDFPGDYKYLPIEGVEIDFDIIQAELGVKGLYLISPTGEYKPRPISQGNNIAEYLGADWQVYIKDSELPSARFSIEISYGDQVLSGPMTFRDVGEYRGISLTISYTDENDIKNYKPYQKHYSEGIKIIPRELEMSTDMVIDTYTGTGIIPSFTPKEGVYVGEDVFDAESHMGITISNYFLHIDGDINNPMNYTKEMPKPSEIKYPGLYKIIILNKNPNYKFNNTVSDNTTVASVIILPAEVVLDLTELPAIEKTYLSQRSAYLSPRIFNISLNGNIVQQEITLGINSEENAFPVVGSYTINKAKAVYHLFSNGDHVLCIQFIVTCGDDKLKINPRYISFDWDNVVAGNVLYKSPELNKFSNDFVIAYKIGENSPLVIVPGDDGNIDLNTLPPSIISRIVITVDKENVCELSAGQVFSVQASLSDVTNFQLLESIPSTKTVRIMPRTIKYFISDMNMYSGAEPPSFVFGDVQYMTSGEESELSPSKTIRLVADTETLAILQSEQSILDIGFTVVGYDSQLDLSGDFSGEINLLLDNEVCVNFNLEKVNNTVKEILVSKRQFNVQIQDIDVVYDGEIKLPEVEIEDATIFYSCSPKNVGSYDLTTTISKIYYVTATIFSRVIIRKATAVVMVEKIELPYRSGYNLVDIPLSFTSKHNDVNISGSASFEKGQTLLFGENTYNAVFIPEDQNNYENTEFDVIIETYISPTDFTFYGGNKVGESAEIDFEDNMIVTDANIYTLSFSKVEGLPNVYMKVNDKLVGESNEYVFEQSEDNVKVQLIAADGSGSVLFETIINVRLANSTNDINQSVEDSPTVPPTDPSEIIAERTSKLSTGAIVGIVVGSTAFVAIVVIIIVVLIKRRKSLNGSI